MVYDSEITTAGTPSAQNSALSGYTERALWAVSEAPGDEQEPTGQLRAALQLIGLENVLHGSTVCLGLSFVDRHCLIIKIYVKKYLCQESSCLGYEIEN